MSRIEDREERRVIRVPKTHSVGMAWALRATLVRSRVFARLQKELSSQENPLENPSPCYSRRRKRGRP
jgi:hypothetical protein